MGEHHEEALIREVHEETVLAVRACSLLGIDARVFGTSHRHAELHAVRLVYETPLSGDPQVAERDGSVDDAAWTTLDDLANCSTVGLGRTGPRMALGWQASGNASCGATMTP